MTKKELIDKLKDIPGDTEIYYKDMNFGGIDSKADNDCIEYSIIHGNILLINSIYWEPVD